jgi:hypothetical protein
MTSPESIDMSGFTNAQLREVLSAPDQYIAEAVHQAAKVLAGRHAVPRYYTRLKPAFSNTHFQVALNSKLDTPTLYSVLFSDANLIRYCLAIAIVQALLLALQTLSVVRILKTLKVETLPQNFTYVLWPVAGILTSLAFVLFFLTLYQTLTRRLIHTQAPD